MLNQQVDYKSIVARKAKDLASQAFDLACHGYRPQFSFCPANGAKWAMIEVSNGKHWQDNSAWEFFSVPLPNGVGGSTELQIALAISAALYSLPILGVDGKTGETSTSQWYNN